ncbi:MAG: signal peptidase I [Candidatus Bathyarchaeota archaeon]|nr:signal peptidase I [Candidatus Bathyarchaeota archaeon]
MENSKSKKLWKNEYVQTVIMIVAIIAIVVSVWYVAQALLRTQYPALAVASGSMCKLPGPQCDGWGHPFEKTLHVGDLIIVQGVSPEEIHAAPEPEGDVIIYQRSSGGSSELIVHRAIRKYTVGNQTFIVTKGDGNSAEDSPISGEQVIGKVVMRIPWVGHLALFMRNSSGVFIIILFIIILVVVEIILPIFTRAKKQTAYSGD